MDDQKESIYSSKDISTDDSLYETINVPEQPTTSPLLLVNSEAWSTSVYDLSDSENDIDFDSTKKRTSSVDFPGGSASSQPDSDKESVGKIYLHRRPGSLYKVEIDKDSTDNLETLESKYKPASVFNAYATSSVSILNTSTESTNPYKEDKSLLELPVLPSDPYNQNDDDSDDDDEEEGILIKFTFNVNVGNIEIADNEKLDRLLENSVSSNIMKQFIKDTIQTSPENCKKLIEGLEEESRQQTKNSIISNDQLLRDWNKEFQDIRDMKESKDKYTKFIELTQDFCYCAKTYGKIIIMEVSLSNKLKTIKPVDIGGAAGGVKYLIQGILFKFSKDSLLQEGLWMYGGYEGPSDEKAMKAALHEFKGVVSLHKLEIKGLHLPLVAIIDFRGFRLIASSWLPISKETLVYGSSDGGLTIHNDNKKLYMKMKKACKRLNLKGHWLLNSGIKFYGAGDIEGHVGYDNKFYVVDLARLFPPQAPLKSERDSRAVFYKLLRPELVRTNSKALSSDAFSGWGATKKLIYNKHVKVATEKLLDTIIPDFVKKLLQSPMHHITVEARLIDKMHRHGINTRFIGKLRDLVPMSPNTLPLRNYLLLEIVSRVIKNILREKLRTKMRELAPPSATPYKSTILAFLNSIVLANKPEDSEIYWKETIKGLIIDKFDGGLSEEELSHSFDLRNNIDITKLFQLIEQSTQIQFDPQVYANLRKNVPITLSKRDIVKFGIKIRIMNIIDFSEAMILTIEATSKEGAESERLFIMAHKKFQEALSKISDDPIALYNWGKCFTLQGSKKNGIIRTVEERLTLLSSGIKRYRASLSIKSDFHECLYWLAKTNAKIAIFKKSLTESQQLLLDAANKYQRALVTHEEMYEQILELKANKKYQKSKQTVGVLNELYLLYAIYILEAIIAVKSDANRLYRLAIWKLELQIAKTNVINPSTLEDFKKPFKIFEEALKQDTSLILTFVEHTRQAFDIAMKASTESAEKLFLSMSLRLTLLEQFGVQNVKEVVDIDYLKATNYGVFLKIMPNSFLHNEFLNTSRLDLSTIPHVTNLVLEKLIDCIGTNIQSLKLANCNLFTENTLMRLQECTNLIELSLRNVTNTSTLVLTTISKKLTQLQVLDVSQCLLLQPNCIADIQNQLTSLNLSNCTNISDNTIEILCSTMPRLKSLKIDDCVKLRNIRCIRKLTSLEELSLNRNKQIPEEILSQLFQDCTKLFILRLKECSQVTDSSFAVLAQNNKRINCINLWGTNVSEKGVGKLVSSKPDWIKVTFPKLSQFSDTILKKFAKSSPNLQKLSLPIAKISDSIVLKIASLLSKLQSLDLRGCEKLNVQTPGKILALLPRLEKFNVSGIHFGGALSSSGSSPSIVQNQTNLVLFGVGSAALSPDLIPSTLQYIKHNGSFIKILDLSKSIISDENCQLIATSCVNLTKLNLSFCDGISDYAVKRISENCAKLEYLFLSKCNNITFYCIHWLSTNLTFRLISLDLSYCSSFVESPPVIKLPSLRTLKLSSCRWITDVVILAITNGCHGLQYLDAENIKISDVTISFITKRCLELRYLLLSSSNMQISASAIKQLATKCFKLQILDLTGINLTEAQTQYFTTDFENLHTLILLGDEKGQRAREQLKLTRPSLTVKTRLL